MNQGNYYFDPETCTFVEVESSYTQYVKRGAVLLGIALMLAAGLTWAIDRYWWGTPEELALRSENHALQEQLARVSEKMNTLTNELDQLAETDRELYRTLLQVDPISDDVRQVGVGGSDPYEAYDRFEEKTSALLRRTSQTLDQLERQMSLQNESYRTLTEEAKERERYLAELPALIPAQGPIVSGYGKRFHPILKVRKMHGGVDVLVRPGTPVVAPADGIVRRAGVSPTYGNYVDLRHPNAGYMTRFAHLSEFADGLRRGQRVERGDTIAYSGNSGRSTGPHLHYEVRDLRTKRTLNPVYFFAPDMTPDRYETLLAQTERLEVATG
jgi:murein DD-endopeptidase MepM/ murein hydrolase activator NlpD